MNIVYWSQNRNPKLSLNMVKISFPIILNQLDFLIFIQLLLVGLESMTVGSPTLFGVYFPQHGLMGLSFL